MSTVLDATVPDYYKTTVPVPPSQPFSFACWFYPTDLSADMQLMSIGDASTTTQFHRLLHTGTDLLTWQSKSSATATRFGSTVKINKWQHVVGTFMGASAGAVSQMYYNGVDEGINGTAKDPTGLDTIGIGVLAISGFAARYTGRLAECAVYNDELDGDDAAALAAGYSPLLVRRDNLYVYRSFIREGYDLINGRVWTEVGTPSVGDHPRIIYPKRQMSSFPTAAGGGDTISPAPIVVSISVVDPAIAVTEKPAPVPLTLSVIDPAVSLTVAPASVAMTLSVVDPTVDSGGLVSPAPVPLTLSVVDPAVAVTEKPAPVAVAFTVVEPVVSVTVRPDPVTITTAVVDPRVSVTVTPSPVVMTISAVDPSNPAAVFHYKRIMPEMPPQGSASHDAVPTSGQCIV